MRYTLKRATNADRAFAERLHEECYRDVVTRQFGAWDSAVQSRFFEQKWQPEHYSIIMFEDEAIGVLAVHDGPDHLLLSEIQICPSHQGRGIGSAIVVDLIERGRKQKISLRLQVLPCSRAR